MIDPSELRIGNCVSVDGVDTKGKECKLQIHLQYIDFMRILSGNNPAYPIPLTEEWLSKFGFKSNDSELPDKHQDWRVWKDYWKGEFCIDAYTCNYTLPDKFIYEYEGSFEIIEREIQYVHQLQNLYFALTGEELTIHI